MQKTNFTTVTYFVLTGITDVPELQTPIFLLVLFMYLLTIGGNMTILLLVFLDSNLHTPMYFFLGNLSIMDLSSITVTLHNVLPGFISGDKTISFLGCMTQFYLFSTFEKGELFLLAVMSFDRYAAICNPLRYHVAMNNRVCVFLAAGCYVLSFTQNIPYVALLFGFTCYTSYTINHFFCDFAALTRLYCSDTSCLEMYLYIEGGFVSIGGLSLLTIIPYIFIIKSILKIRSNTGRHKAFHTCSSHILVVVLLYVSLICQYLRPDSIDSLESNKLFSLFNTVAVPLLNPLIYSLKNKDVKTALKRRLQRLKLMASR